MTNFEIDRKKMNQEELLNDVAVKRSNLTMILLDLMDQQVGDYVYTHAIYVFIRMFFFSVPMTYV